MDDRSIADDTELWRRIPIWHWVKDESVARGFRVSSAAFDDVELSVVIVPECTGGLETLLKDHEDFGVASFTAGDIRRHGWGILREHVDGLPGHAIVTGSKSQGKRSRLAKMCRIIREPVQRDLQS